MTAIPPNPVTAEDIAEWQQQSRQLKSLRVTEMTLRQKIFKGLFLDPKEGTNNYALPQGWTLKANYSITRDVDDAAVMLLQGLFAENNINLGRLIKHKPSLVISEYRKLTEEEQHIFNQCLISKPGSPTLELIPPVKAAP